MIHHIPGNGQRRVNFCIASSSWPQALQWYSYKGMAIFLVISTQADTGSIGGTGRTIETGEYYHSREKRLHRSRISVNQPCE